jgi:hypothetical protein
MATYTVNYSNAENLAMTYIAADVDEWIQNAAHERARVAVEEIVKICVEKCLETNTQIPGSKEEMVELAFEQGWVISASDRNTTILQG